MTSTLPLCQWNAYVGNDSDRVIETLAAWADKYEPAVFALQEVGPHAAALRRHAGELGRFGYSLFQRPPISRSQRRRNPRTGEVEIVEAGNVALLVRRRGFDVVAHRRVTMREPWIGPKHGIPHTPRELELVVGKYDGHRWKVLDVHAPTGGFDGRNRRAFLETARRARALGVSARRDTSYVAVGDWNEGRADLDRFLGPGFDVYGTGVDLLATRRVESVEIRQLGKGGSDTHRGRLVLVRA